MRVAKWSPCIILILLFSSTTFVVAGNLELKDSTIKGKEPLHGVPAENGPLALLNTQSDNSKCLMECLRHNQMASVGGEILQEQCRQECNLEEVLVLLTSSQKDDYNRGVKALSALNNPQAIQPLIIALKRDLTERRGLWAWIIPALGALGDPTAVPVLTHTLTLSDDDWLGREMSAYALGSISDPSSIPHLIAAAWRADTRDTAIEALVSFRDKRTIAVFLSALDQEEDEQTRNVAIKGLHLLGPIAVPQMIEEFNNFSPEHRETSKRLVLCQLLDEAALRRVHAL